jgi:hypothetical protein
MSALDDLSVPVPRPQAVAQRYARQLDPWWGFVLAGAIWAVCTLVVSSLAMMKLGEALDIADGSTGAQVMTLVSLVVFATTGVIVFRWWRRHRLGRKEALLRDGDRLEVHVGRLWSFSRTKTVVELQAADRNLRCAFNRWFLPSNGSTITVIHHPGTSDIVAFDGSGSIYAGHVTGGELAE